MGFWGLWGSWGGKCMGRGTVVAIAVVSPIGGGQKVVIGKKLT